MTLPVWNPSFSVGHPLLDSQHQELLALCNQAADCLADSSLEGTEHFHILLNDLAVYAKKHFRTEEEILIQYDCPLLGEQIAEHQAYEIRLGEFLLAAIYATPDKAGVYRFLSEWWLHHILESDMRYSEFLRGINAKA